MFQMRLTGLVQGKRGKYLGLSLVLAWYYCLWFAPKSLQHPFQIDDRTTYGWLSTLLATVISILLLAIVLGRTRHLPRQPALVWTVAGLGVCATIGISTSVASAVAFYAFSVLAGVCIGLFWVMWGEWLTSMRAIYSLQHLGPVMGVTGLVTSLLVCWMPTVLVVVFVALMPLGSGYLMWQSWRTGSAHGFPPILPSRIASQVSARVFAVCAIGFVAAGVCYFVIAITPWDGLPGGPRTSFCIGLGMGAVIMLVLTLVITRAQHPTPTRPKISQVMPWLVLSSIGVCLLYLLNCYTGAFLVALAAAGTFEVVLVMYMSRLTLSGYVSPATASANSLVAVRSGICVAVGLALLWRHSQALNSDDVTKAMLLAVALLAALLIPLVRQEYAIEELTRDPQDASEWETTIAGIAKQFKLSARETEIIDMLGRGYTATAIAERFVISPHTVNTHVQHIYDKLGIHKRSEMLDYLNKR